jgi:hypothetical protein
MQSPIMCFYPNMDLHGMIAWGFTKLHLTRLLHKYVKASYILFTLRRGIYKTKITINDDEVLRNINSRMSRQHSNQSTINEYLIDTYVHKIYWRLFWKMWSTLDFEGHVKCYKH